MKITDYSRSTPGLWLGTASSANAIGGVSISSNSPAIAGSILVAISSNMAAWRDALSFGSNTNDVSSVGTMGSSPSNTRADHVHRGVHAITAAGSNAVYGDVNLVAGSGMGITTAGQSVRFDATATAIAAGTYLLTNEGEQPTINPRGTMGATETIDPTLGNIVTGTLDQDCVITLGAPVGSGGCFLWFWITEDGTGGHTVSFTGTVTVQGTHDTTLGTTQRAGAESIDGGATWIWTWQGTSSGFVLSHPSTSSNSFTSNAVLTNDATIAITMPQFGTFHLSAPFFSEVVTDQDEIVWHGSDVVHDLVRLY